MEEVDRSPEEESAALRGELLKGKARYLALGAIVYSTKPDWFRPGSTPLDWFFDAPDNEALPVGGEEEPDRPSPLPPAAQDCVAKYSIELKTCNTEEDPASCRSQAWENYKACMATVVMADPISPSTWDPPPTPGPGL